MTMTELTPQENVSPRPPSPVDAVGLTKPDDLQAAASKGNPPGEELESFDQADAAEVQQYDPADEETDVRSADAQQGQGNGEVDDSRKAANSDHRKATEEMVRPVGKIAADSQVDHGSDVAASGQRSPTTTASEIAAASSNTTDHHSARSVAPPEALPVDSSDPPDSSLEDEGEPTGDAEPAGSDTSDETEPVADVSGANNGGGGGEDTLSLVGGESGDQPWKRDLSAADPETRAVVEDLTLRGPNSPQFNAAGDEMLIEYPSSHQGSGYISGHVGMGPDNARAIIDVMSVSPELRGYGLSTSLVDRFAKESERRGIEIIDGWVDSPGELGALHSVFGDNVEFGDPDAPTSDDDAMMIPLTVEQAFQSLSRERAEDLEMEEGMSALTEDRSERGVYSSLYYQVRPENRASAAVAEQADAPAGASPESQEPARSDEDEFPERPMAVIDTSRIDTADGSLGISTAVVEAIGRGEDVRATLDGIARNFPDAGLRIAHIVQQGLLEQNRLNYADPDVLLWIKANLTTDVARQHMPQPVDDALLATIGDEQEVRQIQAAATWARYGDKTTGRVNEINEAIGTLEWGLTTHPEQVPLRDILANNRRPDSNESLEGYGIQPLTAVYAADITEDSAGPKLTALSNEHFADTHGVEAMNVIGGGPLGVLIHHNGVPQEVVAFDVEGSTVTIHQIQGANEYLRRIAGSRQFETVQNQPRRIANFDMSDVAFDTVAQTCAQLGLISDAQQATLRVVSATNNHNVRSWAFPLARALRIYDMAADDRGMQVDADGNWVAPLSQFLAV